MGSILDRKYDLQEKIGEGAMGTVYRATHVVTQQELAVKVLSASRASETAKARFLREVRLAGALRHRNVVQVVDAGEDEASETLYIVMEYLVGRNLEEVFESGELSRREALAKLHQVLPALAEAHDAGIVHRDLKPENLFLGTDGVVKLLDFGVARDLGGAKVTATGTAMGTPVYMSPEQGLRPKEIDHRSDLWSVGVILYEIAASYPPFYDESPHAVVFKANAEPHVPLGDLVPGTPPALAALVDRCLAKDKEGRPADARAIAAVLEEVLADVDAAPFLGAPVAFGTGEVDPATAPVPLHSSPPPSGPSAETVEAAIGGRSRAWVGAVALVAIALVGWLGWSLSRPAAEAPRPVAGPSEEAPEAAPEPAPERAPEPVPIQPIVDAPEPESEPAPRLARRSPTSRTPEPERRTERPEPEALMAPERMEPSRPESPPTEAPSPSEEPTDQEPTVAAMAPEATPEPSPPEPSPVVRPERATTPTADRPSRRSRRARSPRPPAREPEPPPLTF